jgi:hypothetical protein
MRKSFDTTYIIFLAIYTALIVSSNLIFQKFVTLQYDNHLTLEISAGLLAFPLTFLITDIVSEVYGKKAAKLMIWVGFTGFFVVALTVKLANYLPSTSWSPITDFEFNKVFGFIDIVFFASLLSSFVAQIVDVNIFHFISDQTRGRHLWLRNNCSTIISQLVDTLVVISILVYFNVVSVNVMNGLFINSYLYKFIFAILNTPLIYIFVFLLKSSSISSRVYGKA